MGNVGIKNGETVALVKVSQSLFWNKEYKYFKKTENSK